MNHEKLINILTQQRNHAMDNVALLALERDEIAEELAALRQKYDAIAPAPVSGDTVSETQDANAKLKEQEKSGFIHLAHRDG